MGMYRRTGLVFGLASLLVASAMHGVSRQAASEERSSRSESDVLDARLLDDEGQSARAPESDGPRWAADSLVRVQFRKFRMRSGKRLSTTEASLDASFIAGVPSSTDQVVSYSPKQIEGELRVRLQDGEFDSWRLTPGNFDQWSPLVTFNPTSKRVTVHAPIRLVRERDSRAVPIFLILHCRLGGVGLKCYRAASVFEELRLEFNGKYDFGIDALDLDWEPYRKTTNTSGVMNTSCCMGPVLGGGQPVCTCSACEISFCQTLYCSVPDPGCGES